jgi:nucleotide-binding universal stress UspA family protein
MYEYVIVPFDGTKQAQQASLVAADLAHLMGAELVVMTAHGIDTADAIAKVKDRAMAMSDTSVTVWIEPVANEAKAVASMLSFRPNSLICMSTSGRTGVLRATYGSMVERLLREVDAPIVAIGPKWAGTSVVDLSHLVVCMDGTPTAEAAIPLAARWAALRPLNVTLVHVRSRHDEASVDLDRLGQTLESTCEIVDRVTVDDDDVVDGILEVVHHSISPFVVIATSARTGLDRFVHGSVTASLLAKCPVPVLVQRGHPVRRT